MFRIGAIAFPGLGVPCYQLRIKLQSSKTLHGITNDSDALGEKVSFTHDATHAEGTYKTKSLAGQKKNYYNRRDTRAG
jgi:hypothetical protein